MISFLKKLKIYKLKAKSYKLDRGMTYVELIVVLGIFSLMTSIVLFNYKGFQAKVDIKVLANDIALKIVEAQKSSIFGKWNIYAKDSNTWKPSYGVYLDSSNTNNKKFFYFADLNQNSFYDVSTCQSNGECLDQIDITKGNFISKIEKIGISSPGEITKPLSITFKRPDSGAIFFSNGSKLSGFDYIQITISSPGSSPYKAYIRISPSGKIYIN